MVISEFFEKKDPKKKHEKVDSKVSNESYLVPVPTTKTTDTGTVSSHHIISNTSIMLSSDSLNVNQFVCCSTVYKMLMWVLF